ncbi:MAG: hypothetical protein S4CHLAM102_11410 [Chlamydiia bacterium]|nr:hypothetical protein [Chlamydiia bacterium]
MLDQISRLSTREIVELYDIGVEHYLETPLESQPEDFHGSEARYFEKVSEGAIQGNRLVTTGELRWMEMWGERIEKIRFLTVVSMRFAAGGWALKGLMAKREGVSCLLGGGALLLGAKGVDAFLGMAGFGVEMVCGEARRVRRAVRIACICHWIHLLYLFREEVESPSVKGRVNWSIGVLHCLMMYQRHVRQLEGRSALA